MGDIKEKKERQKNSEGARKNNSEKERREQTWSNFY